MWFTLYGHGQNFAHAESAPAGARIFTSTGGQRTIRNWRKEQMKGGAGTKKQREEDRLRSGRTENQKRTKSTGAAEAKKKAQDYCQL